MGLSRKDAKELKKFDPQCLYFFDRQQERWAVLRMPERCGSLPKNLGNWEIQAHLRNGRLTTVMTLQTPVGGYIEPGSWVLAYLAERDIRRISAKDWLRELDNRNEKLQQKIQEQASERVTHRVKEDFMHIKDEITGDPTFRKYTMTVGIDLKSNGKPSDA